MGTKPDKRDVTGVLRRVISVVAGGMLASALSPVGAQTRPTTGPADPPATQPAATQPAGGGAQTGLNLRDVTLASLLDQIQESDGLKIVNEAPPDLRLPPISGKHPMSRA